MKRILLRRLLLAGTLVGSLTALACSTDDTTHSDTLDMVEVSTMCSMSEPCPGTQRCDVTTSQCYEPCTPQSCPQGQICDDTLGMCQVAPPCESNEDCANLEVCDTCRGACVSSDERRECVEAINCTIDAYCDPCTKLCAAKPALCEPCLYDYECGDEDDRCVDIISAGGRFCTQDCTSLSDCPSGYDCANISGDVSQCVPASGH